MYSPKIDEELIPRIYRLGKLKKVLILPQEEALLLNLLINMKKIFNKELLS